MSTTPTELDVYVLRSPKEPNRLQVFSCVLRDLRLLSLRESPDSFTEKHDEASAKPAVFWEEYVKKHNGLIHIAFGMPVSESPKLDKMEKIPREDLILASGKPLGMAVNTGPVPNHLFLSLPGSGVPRNRPDSEELRFHGGMLFHVPEMRGAKKGHLFEHLVLDRDEWLLEKLQSAQSDPPPLARFRGNVKPGSQQSGLISFYTRAGWYLAGTQTWRVNLLAEGGENAVRAAGQRGDNMDEVSVVVEKIFTVAHLERQIRRNRSVLGRPEAHL